MTGIARTLTTLAVATLLLATSAADAALTTSAFLVQKRKAWITFRKCQGTEQVKQLKGKPADLATCDAALQAALTKINAKATKAAIPCRYGDIGDGTVTDYDTGLQWEKKTGGVADLCILGDVNCVNDTYDWDGANRFVGASATGSTLTTCFFGHCDWRLPTIVELRTILLAPNPCATSPCIDPIFGPTVASFYWSATTYADNPNGAWYVPFSNLSVLYDSKGSSHYVRAVRTGL